MQLIRSLRRSIATTLVSAGFAYPACAAVCPRGIGGCPSPGKCFLFVDADGNGLCDYLAPDFAEIPDIAPSVSGVPEQPGPEVVQTAVPAGNGSPQALLHALPPGPPASIPPGLLVTGLLFFVTLTAMLRVIVQRGLFGIREERPLPATALAAVPAFCVSLIILCTMSGEAVAGTTCALLYASGGTVLTAYLWHAGAMTRRTVLLFAGLGTLAGFVFVAPIMPLETGWLLNIATGRPVPAFTVAVLLLLLAMTLVFGRVFCGHLCPVGALQELAYALPGKKIVIQKTGAFELLRAGIFLLAVAGFFCSFDVMALTGLHGLFSLALTIGFWTGAALVLLSVIVYRPVCRAICPFGLIFSILAQFSLFRLRQGPSCTGCGKCENVCPAGALNNGSSTRECYLCGRCRECCPGGAGPAYRR
jgi:ferredoxin-type protein NapH